ncbi:MAG: DUF350 domain-containing protein [Desulfitobacterium hafniense]|nr:DUF350 domain-containing protein [Desulfitobacterium hafniense]
MENLLLNYFIYFGLSVLLMIIGVTGFVFTTKIKEFTMIGEGNVSAAILVSGRVLGLAVILYSAISNSISIFDLMTWAFIGIVTQIIANFLVEFLTRTYSIETAIINDNRAVAIALASMFISIGLIIAGCLTY